MALIATLEGIEDIAGSEQYFVPVGPRNLNTAAAAVARARAAERSQGLGVFNINVSGSVDTAVRSGTTALKSAVSSEVDKILSTGTTSTTSRSTPLLQARTVSTVTPTPSPFRSVALAYARRKKRISPLLLGGGLLALAVAGYLATR